MSNKFKCNNYSVLLCLLAVILDFLSILESPLLPALKLCLKSSLYKLGVFQDQSSLPGVFYLNFASGIESSVDKHNKAKPWTSMLSEYMQRVISRRKSSQSISESHESLHTGKLFVLLELGMLLCCSCIFAS